ncbi:helix-turn-helix domain-containing protein [Morganella morganii]|nr:helix-turn-helix transcriptional regulator [Morganella morganii]EMB6210193.1 helix-turn-helix transcriptional regulator [Morganella morganii]
MMKNKDNYVNTCVGRKIRATRESVGMTESQLAQLTGLSQQQISRYESGKTSMTIDTVVMIAHALDISLSKLLSDYLPASEEDNSVILVIPHDKNR